MNIVLEMCPFAVFLAVTLLSDVYKGTIALMIALVVVIGIFRLWRGEWRKMPLITAGITMVLGGLTLYLHDANFIKLKPTILFAGFSMALLGSQFFGEKVLVERVAGGSLALPSAVWRKINVGWTLFYAVCALLNLYIAHTYSDRVWVIFKFGGFTVLPILYAVAHLPFLMPYLEEDSATGGKGTA